MSLKDAVRLALNRNKSVEASNASTKAAESRIAEARSGNLPKVNYSESWTRSDNPVFVFSSLLTQHQFGEQNFQIGPLNRPDFLNNFQSQVTADQTLYDGGQTKHAVRSAELTKDITGEDGRRTRMEVIAGVIRSYYDALLGAEQFNATSQAMRSAQADLDRAESVRSAGMSTDVDVLSIRVHLAGVREQQIRREADLDVARAALNDALGLPLDTAHTLTTGLAPLRLPDGLLADYEKNALGERPEARQVKLAVNLAENSGGHCTQQSSAAGRRSRRFRGGSAEFLRQGRGQLAGFHRTALEPVQRLQRQGAHRGKQVRTAPERGRAGARQFRNPASGASGVRRPARRRAAHRSGGCSRRGGGRESSHHPEPLRNRAEQCHRLASHGDGGSRSADPASGGDSRSAHRGGNARTGGRDADANPRRS